MFSWATSPSCGPSRRHVARRRSASRGREHFPFAAKAIGAAVLLDGLDGRIARMTNTTSDFGREMDSLADVISFGIAPAVLAFAWGVQFVDHAHRPHSPQSDLQRRLLHRVPVPAVRSGAPGALQYSEEPRFPRIPAGRTASISSACPFPAAAGMVAAVVLRVRWRADRWWPLLGGLAGAAGAAGISDGQHLALLQLQRHQSSASPTRRCIVILVGACIYARLELRRRSCCWR